MFRMTTLFYFKASLNLNEKRSVRHRFLSIFLVYSNNRVYEGINKITVFMEHQSFVIIFPQHISRDPCCRDRMVNLTKAAWLTGICELNNKTILLDNKIKI